MALQKKSSATGRLIAASSEESADILYASGFYGPDEFFWFDCGGGRKGVLVSSLEYSRALKEVRRGVAVLTASSLGISPAGGALLPVALAEKYGIRKWIVPPRFPLACADALRKAGIEVECSDGEFFPERRIKKKSECAAIGKAMKATEEAMMLVHDILKRSTVNSSGQLVFSGKILTCDFLRAEVEAEFKRKAFSASRTIIACGRDSARPHCIGSGPVLAGQPVVADIFPRSDITGYWGDMTRTFLKGKAPTVVRKAFDAVKAASETALGMIRAGVRASDVHLAAAEVMARAGFPTGRDPEGNPCGFFHSLGHGVGLEIHELPRVSPANDGLLQSGNVISVEPGLYYAAWGGVRLEDLVLVTQDSCRNFCSMPKELEIP